MASRLEQSLCVLLEINDAARRGDRGVAGRARETLRRIETGDRHAVVRPAVFQEENHMNTQERSPTKTVLLRAAVKLLAKVVDMRMQDVGTAVGTRKSIVHYHFTSKALLIREAIREHMKAGPLEARGNIGVDVAAWMLMREDPEIAAMVREDWDAGLSSSFEDPAVAYLYRCSLVGLQLAALLTGETPALLAARRAHVRLFRGERAERAQTAATTRVDGAPSEAS